MKGTIDWNKDKRNRGKLFCLKAVLYVYLFFPRPISWNSPLTLRSILGKADWPYLDEANCGKMGKIYIKKKGTEPNLNLKESIETTSGTSGIISDEIDRRIQNHRWFRWDESLVRAKLFEKHQISTFKSNCFVFIVSKKFQIFLFWNLKTQKLRNVFNSACHAEDWLFSLRQLSNWRASF